jgi:hypothetical protein
MWRGVDPGLIDVSEERIASIFRIGKIRERGTSVSRWLHDLHSATFQMTTFFISV